MLGRLAGLAMIVQEAVLRVYVMHPGAVFSMKIRRGVLKVGIGKAPRGFIEDCERIVTDSDLRRGTIIGIQRGRKTFLKFSHNIPKRCQQRFRNAWHSHK